MYLLAATHPIPSRRARERTSHLRLPVVGEPTYRVCGLSRDPRPSLSRAVSTQPLIGKKLRDADEHYFVSSGTATGTDSGTHRLGPAQRVVGECRRQQTSDVPELLDTEMIKPRGGVILEGHRLEAMEVGHSDCDGSTVLQATTEDTCSVPAATQTITERTHPVPTVRADRAATRSLRK